VDDFTLEEWVCPELFDLDKNISLGTTETAQASSDNSQLPDADICPYGTLLNSDIDEFADSNLQSSTWAFSDTSYPMTTCKTRLRAPLLSVRPH
jgi:hypothetical protein